jgi:hypothetical protein
LSAAHAEFVIATRHRAAYKAALPVNSLPESLVNLPVPIGSEGHHEVGAQAKDMTKQKTSVRRITTALPKMIISLNTLVRDDGIATS